MQANSSISNFKRGVFAQAKPWVIKSILYFFSLFILFFIFEIALRIFWTLPADTRTQFLLEHNALYGWRNIPNTKSFNSKGIRGPEYSFQKKENECRLLVLGDSHAEGYGVNFQDLFSEIMKRRLNLNKKDDRDREVINAGTTAYSTDQELLFFENEGKKYQPDFTILIFSSNNVFYNPQTMMSYWHKPRFRLNDGKLELTHVPVPESPEPVSYRIRQFLRKHCYTSKFFYRKITQTYFYTWLTRMGLTPFPERYRVFQKNYTREVHDAWRLTEALLAKMKQEVELSGSQFLIFYVPLPASVYPEAWKERREKYAMSEVEWDPLQDSREFAAICRRNGIDFINPVEQFRTEAERLRVRGKKLYSFEDDHWTIDGHELAGEILAQYFMDHDLMKLEKK